MSTERTLHTLVATARSSTGAEAAFLLAPTEDDRLEVVAVDGPGALDATTVEPDETYGAMVLASQQPMAMQVGPDDSMTRFEARVLGRRPSALCAVPCIGVTDVRGVLALVDKAGGGSFDFDDVEVATMLAEIAGAGLDERDGPTAAPSPDALASMLRELSQREPERYRRVASLVEMVLAAG